MPESGSFNPNIPDPYRPDYLPAQEHLDAFPEEASTAEFGAMTEWDNAYQKHIETLAPDEFLLTSEQEKELSLAIQAGKEAGAKRLDLDPNDAQKAQLDYVYESGRAARDTLVVSNLRLAAWFVRNTMDFNKQRRTEQGLPGVKGAVYKNLATLAGGELEYSDRMQLASIGLMRAAESYNGEKRFSTYAMYSMEHELGDATFVDQSPLKLPPHKIGEIRRFEKTQVKLEDSLMRQPTYKEISAGIETGSAIGEKAAMELDYLSQRRQKISYEELDSLYQSHEFEKKSADPEYEVNNIADQIADSGIDKSVYEEVVLSELSERLDRALAELDERSQRILEMRFGLETGVPMTFEECGREFNMTRERIRSIEAKALAALRRPDLRVNINNALEESETPTFGVSTELKIGEAIESELHLTRPRPYIFESQSKSPVRLDRPWPTGSRYTLEEFKRMQEDSKHRDY